MKILESLNWRYATKKFDPSKKLEEKQVSELLEVLNLTPTSYGLQPLKFIRVKNTEKRKQLLEASWNQKQIVDASDLIIICIENELKEEHIANYIKLICEIRNEDPNNPRFESYKLSLMKVVDWTTEEYLIWAKKQAYIALGNLMTSCAFEKIDSCPMEGFQSKKYDEILNLNELEIQSVLVCPIGYRSEEDANATMKKVRKNRADIIIEI